MRSSVNLRSAAVALMAFSICTATVHAQQHAIIGETVSLPSGELQGVPVMGGKVVQFLGVPFAQPPVGDLRWRAPLREKPWSGTLQANHIKAACMQGNPWYPQPVSEDCLYLNVYVPATASSDKPLATLLWVHGGGFSSGDTGGGLFNGAILFNGTYNARMHNVIVVSVSYRLGVFGFLGSKSLISRSPQDGTGNYGIQDQRMAMEWTQRNIKYFGGDPKRVMIHGCSAGGVSIANHLAQPRSWPLFSSAVMESGNFLVFQDGTSLDDAEHTFDRLVRNLNCDDAPDAVACLLSKNASAVLNGGGGHGAPVVDGVNLVDFPSALLLQGKVSQVPTLLGSTRDELSSLSRMRFAQYANMTKREWETYLAQNYGAKYVSKLSELYSPADYPFAEGGAPCAGDAKESKGCSVYYYLLAKLSTDQAITCPTREAARQLSSAIPKQAFQYSWEFPSYGDNFNASVDLSTNFIGHCTQRSYEMSNEEWLGSTPDHPADTLHQDISALVSSFWTNLAKYGDPNGAGDDKVPAARAWAAYSNATDQSYRFGNSSALSGMAANAQARCDFLTTNFPHGSSVDSWLHQLPGAAGAGS